MYLVDLQQGDASSSREPICFSFPKLLPAQYSQTSPSPNVSRSGRTQFLNGSIIMRYSSCLLPILHTVCLHRDDNVALALFYMITHLPEI